jgi:membrane protein YdbS with pleckstrin-like domain
MSVPPDEPPGRRREDPDDRPEAADPDWNILSNEPDRHDYPPPPGAADEADTQVLGVATVPDDDGRPRIDPEELAGLQEDPASSAGVRRVLPLEDEASHLVARYLFPTERYRGEWKKHFIHLVWPMVIGVLSTFALGWLSGVLADTDLAALSTITILLWLGVMGYLAWRVADWHFDRFILTNKRVMVVHGIITRRVAMMPLLRVTDMKYEQSPLGRVLNYGTFVLESAGQDQALREVPHLPNPNELYLRVVEEMYEPAAVEARLGRSVQSEDEEERVGDS